MLYWYEIVYVFYPYNAKFGLKMFFSKICTPANNEERYIAAAVGDVLPDDIPVEQDRQDPEKFTRFRNANSHGMRSPGCRDKKRADERRMCLQELNGTTGHPYNVDWRCFFVNVDLKL